MVMLGHLMRAIFHSFFRIVLAGVVCALLAASIVFVIALDTGMRQWPPSALTLTVLIAVAALSGYAGAVTVLVNEVLRTMVKALKAAEKDPLSTAHMVGESVRAVEHAHKS